MRKPGTAPKPPRTSVTRTALAGCGSVSAKSSLLRKSEHQVHVLHGRARRAFAEIVDAAQNMHDAAALRNGDLPVIRLLKRWQIGNACILEYGNERACGIIPGQG